jgi:hypothetical protein
VTDDELLAAVMRRFIADHDLAREFWVGENHLRIEDDVNISDEEQSAIVKVLWGAS